MPRKKAKAKKQRVAEVWETVQGRALSIVNAPIRFLRTVLMVTGAITLGSISMVLLVVYLFFSSLPDVASLTYEQLASTAHDRTVEKFEKPPGKVRWTSIDNISRDLIYAIVMAEDARFFEHGGINYDAMIEAMIRNWKSRRFEVGGSTITQQVVKNVFLTNEKSLYRKLKEYFVARSLEESFDKNQILEVYLNVAEFGPDIFGIGAAAKYYFNKTPKRLNAGEGAYLALMLPSPRKNHFSIHVKNNLGPSKRAKIRRILRDMRSKELISDAEYHKYLSTALTAH